MISSSARIGAATVRLGTRSTQQSAMAGAKPCGHMDRGCATPIARRHWSVADVVSIWIRFAAEDIHEALSDSLHVTDRHHKSDQIRTCLILRNGFLEYGFLQCPAGFESQIWLSAFAATPLRRDRLRPEDTRFVVGKLVGCRLACLDEARPKVERSLAGRQGFEPRYRGPEPRVLPLDDLPIQVFRGGPAAPKLSLSCERRRAETLIIHVRLTVMHPSAALHRLGSRVDTDAHGSHRIGAVAPLRRRHSRRRCQTLRQHRNRPARPRGHRRHLVEGRHRPGRRPSRGHVPPSAVEPGTGGRRRRPHHQQIPESNRSPSNPLLDAQTA